jgi:hypothetical protein
MRHFVSCFKAGLHGQPMPARADRATGKTVAITSAMIGGGAVAGFGIGMIVRHLKPRVVETEKD